MATRSRRPIDSALREDREQRKISIPDLAQRSGIAESVIAEIEAGNHNPLYEERAVLSRALGTPLPGVSGGALETFNGAMSRMAESLRDNAGDGFITEIKEITKRLNKVTSNQLGHFQISKADPKKLRSELLKLKKAITEIESRVNEA